MQKMQASSNRFPQNNHNKIIRETPTLKCIYVQPDPQNISQSSIIYQITSFANPFMSLLEVYNILAVATTKILTREMMQFMARCVMKYLQNNQLQQLTSDFYPVTLSTNWKAQLEPSLQNLMQKTNEQLQNLDLSVYPTTSSCVSKQFQTQQLRYFLQLMRQNLNSYQILPRSYKMERLKRLTNKLRIQFNIELIINQKEEIITIRMRNKGVIQKIITLEEGINDGRKISIGIDNIDSIREKVYYEILEYNKCVYKFYDDQPKAYFKVHPSNVLLYIREEKDNQLVLGNQPVGLDIISVILDELGLGSHPISFEQMLVFNSTPHPPLNRFDFLPILKSAPKKENTVVKHNEAESILSWLLFCDTLHSRLLSQDKITMYQLTLSSEDAFKAFENKDPEYLNSQTIIMLLMFELFNHEQNMTLSYTYLKWKSFLSNLDIKQDSFFTDRKFQRARIILLSMERLYFSEQNIKNIIERNKNLNGFENVGRYVFLYILAKYPLLQLDLNILRSDYVGQNILDEKYKMKIQIEKLMNICTRVQKKIDEDYRNRTKEDGNTKFMVNNNLLFELYDRLKQYQTVCITMKQTNQEETKAKISDIQILKQSIQKESWKLMYQNQDNKFPKKGQAFEPEQQPQEINRDQEENKFKDRLKQKKNPSISHYLTFSRQQILLDLYFSYSLQNYSLNKSLEAELVELTESLQHSDIPRIDASMREFRKKIPLYLILDKNPK